MSLRHISIFSGIKCVSPAAAAAGADWEPVCFAETAPFPAAVLLHRAKRRGKALPPILEYALTQQAKGRVAASEPLEAPVALSDQGAGAPPRVTHTLQGEGWDGSEDGTGRDRPLIVNHTLIPWRKGYAADGPRCKAVGNGMALPCAAWVTKRMHESHSAHIRAG